MVGLFKTDIHGIHVSLICPAFLQCTCSSVRHVEMASLVLQRVSTAHKYILNLDNFKLSKYGNELFYTSYLH